MLCFTGGGDSTDEMTYWALQTWPDTADTHYRPRWRDIGAAQRLQHARLTALITYASHPEVRWLAARPNAFTVPPA